MPSAYDDASGEVTVHGVEGDAATLPADRTYRVEVVRPSLTAEERVFAVLDRAQMAFEVKVAVYDAVRAAPDPGAAVITLQAMELPGHLLGAVSEILLAR